MSDAQDRLVEDASRGVGTLEITSVEPLGIHTPVSLDPTDAFIEMPPMGLTYDRDRIGTRLDYASPSGFKGHSQTVLVKATTDQGIVELSRPMSDHAPVWASLELR